MDKRRLVEFLTQQDKICCTNVESLRVALTLSLANRKGLNLPLKKSEIHVILFL